MKRPNAWKRGFVVTSALCLVASPYLHAQTAQAPAASSTEEQPIVLSPFVVEASEDAGSYQANSTLAGTRVRTDLKDVASSISVVTQQFLTDTGTHNAQDLLVYTPNTEVGGLQGNYSGQAAGNIYNEPLTNPSNTTRVRGLDAANNTRNYFVTDIPWDSFNVGRVDLQRGPNSILFGVGSPAGIINVSINSADFKNAYKFENVTSSYGSQRNLIDINQQLIKQQLAIRFAALRDEKRFKQEPAFNNSTRYFGALHFDPKLFDSERAHTSLRVSYENGTIKSDNPRTLPPDDQITPWFTRLNKATINEYTPAQGASSVYAQTNFKQAWALGRDYWPIPINYFNGSSTSAPGLSPNVASSIPTSVIIGEMTTGWAINSAGQTAPPNQPGQGSNIGIAGLPDFQLMAIAPYSHWANANLPGGASYGDKVLTDPSIFDFYNKLLDGRNKREWQNWNAFNAALSQTFFNDRLGFELAYDRQEYESGQVGFLGGENYGINVDVNFVQADGSFNPNLGRPYVSNGAESGNQKSKIDRDTARITLNGELRGSDFFGNSFLGKLIGRHVFTALGSIEHRNEKDVSWSQYASDASWESFNNYDLSVKIANYRLYNWVYYLGNSLQGASSASGAHLSNVGVSVAPGTGGSVRWFDSHWNHSLNPSDPGYVNPADPYYYIPSDTPTPSAGGTLLGGPWDTATSTQSNNPANYVGWRTVPITWLSADNPQQFSSLVTGGNQSRYRDESKALTWQGYVLDGDLLGQAVITYGWRRDQISNTSTSAPIDSSTSLAALNYPDDPTKRLTTDGQTRTWGGVYHLPRKLTKHLPGDTTISLSYNNAHNFNAGAPRYNLAGNQIPNPDGVTKEYGVAITTLGDKITFKATHYQTTVHYATLSSDALGALGGLSYLEYLIPAWGYGYAAQVQAGLDGKYGDTTLNGPGDTAGGTSWNYAARDALVQSNNPDLSVIGTPAGAANVPVATYGYQGSGSVTMTDIVNAWIHLPVPDNYFDYYGITGNRPIPSLTHSTGKLYLGFASPMVGSNLPGVGGQQPSLANPPVTTVDNLSEGWEYELNAQPIKNWNITINYSKTSATKTNIDAVTQQFMADNLAFYQGPGGQLRLWGASQTAGYGANTTPTGPIPTYPYTAGQANGSTVGPQWITGVYNQYAVIAKAQGQSAPEISPWRLNVITNYTFDRGRLKGAFIGGAIREEAGRILGYGLDTSTYLVDVNKVLRGPNDTYFDLWFGYSRKFDFMRKVNWRIALNMRNVGSKTKLVPARYEPDGSLALARIEEGMTWQLTNTFEF